MKILHCFRDPVGGIFRHVRDLLSQQYEAGHEVGILCDSTTGGEYEDKLFEQIKPQLKLGLHRIPMTRSITPSDFMALKRSISIVKDIQPDLIHSHSAKGGVYGRLAAHYASNKGKKIKAFYCPHGGAMHYAKGSLKGMIFFTAERFLERFTDSLIFVSKYEQNAYHDKVGKPKCDEAIVYNGLSEEEFTPVEMDDKPADFLYIGMKRDLKGPDVFLDALNIIKQKTSKEISAFFVGDGPDEAKYNEQIQTLGLQDNVEVRNAMPAREAFSKADIVVVPSRAESMPYLVLEAMAAHKPIVCSNVGGIPEIFLEDSHLLATPGDPQALAGKMLAMMENPQRQAQADKLSNELKQRFSLTAMADGMEAIYHKYL